MFFPPETRAKIMIIGSWGPHTYDITTQVQAQVREEGKTGKIFLFSYVCACACVAPVHMYLFSCLCLRRTCQPAFK